MVLRPRQGNPAIEEKAGTQKPHRNNQTSWVCTHHHQRRRSRRSRHPPVYLFHCHFPHCRPAPSTFPVFSKRLRNSHKWHHTRGLRTCRPDREDNPPPGSHRTEQSRFHTDNKPGQEPQPKERSNGFASWPSLSLSAPLRALSCPTYRSRRAS